MSGILVAETSSGQSLALGTMRMLAVERSEAKWLDFLSEAHRLGLQTLHSSVEYDSFPLLSSLLSQSDTVESLPKFRHIAKLAEPSFDDQGFDTSRLRNRVEAYLSALSTPVLHDVQWMWRQSLNIDELRVEQFDRQLDLIAEAVGRLKRDGLIERFFCFPYSIAFGRVALEHEAIDGLIVYRNVQETEYDPLIDRSYELSKPCHIIRPFNAGVALETDQRTHGALLAFALDKPAIESAILSSNSIEHLQQLAAVVRPVA
jgi:aryl-alcohol dehydrogenase-like predicted oxidoreductase